MLGGFLLVLTLLPLFLSLAHLLLERTCPFAFVQIDYTENTCVLRPARGPTRVRSEERWGREQLCDETFSSAAPYSVRLILGLCANLSAAPAAPRTTQ